MIIKISVTGFKSLNKFSIIFNKGLNVLIGPNGSGKTNICQAIGLVSAVAEGNLSDYILSLGGAEAIFSKCNNTKKRHIEIECIGETTTKRFGSNSIQYEYSFSIVLMEKLVLKDERIILRKRKGKTLIHLLEVNVSVNNNGEKKGSYDIKVQDKKELGPTSMMFLSTQNPKNTAQKYYPYKSILDYVRALLYYGQAVQLDLKNAKVFNIDPFLAKKPSDILETSKMLSNGRYLSNAIHEIFSKKENNAIESINSILSKIYPRFKKLDKKESDENLMRTFFIEDDIGMQCSAQSLSDGTIKLIGLLVGIFTQEEATSIIEEPENYLHPWACQILIDYFRNYFQKRVSVITTHSETILNQIMPKEIIVVNNKMGNTKANRIKNQKSLKDAIKLSGFGCGYHYVAGAIGGVPE